MTQELGVAAEEKFKDLLRDMFLLDFSALDFGLYRIMRLKKNDIEEFLQNGIGSIIDQLNLEETTDKKDVFSYLLEFFSRYYHEGDFMSLRRRKWHNYTYAIPYNGEEVKLYWANHDQYYIKSSEYFRNYTFRLERLGWKVTFEVVSPEANRDNLKGGKRVFVPLGAEVVKESDGLRLVFREKSDKLPVTVSEEEKRLTVRFTFREVTLEGPGSTGRGRKASVDQDKINAEIAEWLLMEKTIPMEVRHEFEREVEVKNNKSEKIRLIDRHLRRFTRKNTFDFFIHKNLKEFLTRELDFYLKSEVVDLTVLETLAPERVKAHLCLAKAIRLIGEKIIEFLSQIENFQKKLWLKKKFIWDTQYCITLDRIFGLKDKERRKWLLERIFSNQAQIEEWKELYRVHELVEAPLFCSAWDNSSSETLRKLVEENPRLRYLVVDTRHFDEEFKLKLISSFDNLDEELDGLLVHGENFQALNLLLERYRGQVKCIYIDPPYNTGEDEFLFKDNYQHSSWLAMIENRFRLTKKIMGDDGVIFVSIGEQEIDTLNILMDNIFDSENKIAIIARVMKTASDKGNFFAPTIDFILNYAKNIIQAQPYKDEVDIKLYPKIDENGRRYRDDVALYQSALDPMRGCENQRYYIQCPDGSFVIPPGKSFPSKIKDGALVKPRSKEDKVWRWTVDTYLKNKHLLVFKKTKTSPLLNEKGEKAIWNIYTKSYLDERQERGTRPRNLITDFINRKGADLLKKMGLEYNYSKPVELIQYLIKISQIFYGVILDYFAGSGTTAHAVINLNREDGGKRKYILVEVANYFDTVLLPRIKKVVFSRDWKDGKPKPDKDGSLNGVSHFLKYIRLESYEDTLNNLKTLEETNPERKEALEIAFKKSPKFREDFMLHYLLDFETRESPSLLPIEAFKDPWAYTLEIATEVVGETRPVKVDLVETFNYLLGLRVKHISEKERFTVPRFYHDKYQKLRVEDNSPGSPEEFQNATQEKVWTFQTVEGELPDGRRALVIWRTLGDDPEKDCAILETFMEKKGYAARDTEFEVIYINGQHTLPGSFKVHRTEFEFKDRMFKEIEV